MKIIIPGVPVPQARMRHSNFRGFVTTYDPNAKQKKGIRAFLEQFRQYLPFDYPRISFLFHMPVLKSTKKKDLGLYNSGFLKHDKKPDIDNLIKLYLDVLDGIVIFGDQKVSLGPCLKVYGSEPKTIIWIHETYKIMQLHELDLVFADVSEFGRQYFFPKDCLPDSDNPELLTPVQFPHNLHPPHEVSPLNLFEIAHHLEESIKRVY